jgi:hypothetical protein
MSKQKREVEWSFDFDDLGSRVGQFFSDVTGSDVELKTAELDAPLEGATSATVKVDFSVGRANLVALASDSDNIFEAQIAYVGEYEFEVTGTTEKKIKLRQKGSFPRGFGSLFGNKSELVWNIALSQKLPYDLNLKGGVGETDIDLTHVTVDKLKLETGVGKMSVTLPIQDTTIDAKIHGGVGKADVIVPANVGGKLDIQGGVGAVDVVVAPSAAVRVKANAGLGGIHLPKPFERISGDGTFMGMKGTWETPNFADSDHQLIIDYNGGVGSLRVKLFEVV